MVQNPENTSPNNCC